MTPQMLPEDFAKIRETYSSIHVCVSPPRCCSTAFARAFWEQPSVAFYAHEPFEVTHFRGSGLAEVAEKLEHPLDLIPIKGNTPSPGANSLMIKEMPYQVGDHFPLLAALASPPLIFLLRDPRLAIASRMGKKIEVGDSPVFPLIETGWELLRLQVQYCRDHQIPFLIVHAEDFRNHPEQVFEQVFANSGLPFSRDMLTWRSCAEVDIDNLEGQHRHLYYEVLGSTGFSPETEEVPPIESFPSKDGFRDHVERCIEVCDQLGALPERILT